MNQELVTKVFNGVVGGKRSNPRLVVILWLILGGIDVKDIITLTPKDIAKDFTVKGVSLENVRQAAGEYIDRNKLDIAEKGFIFPAKEGHLSLENLILSLRAVTKREGLSLSDLQIPGLSITRTTVAKEYTIESILATIAEIQKIKK